MRHFLIFMLALAVSTAAFADLTTNFTSAECEPLTATTTSAQASFNVVPGIDTPECLVTNEDTANYAFVLFTNDPSVKATLPTANVTTPGSNVLPVGPGVTVLWHCVGKRYIDAITRTGSVQIDINRGQGN